MREQYPHKVRAVGGNEGDSTDRVPRDPGESALLVVLPDVSPPVLALRRAAPMTPLFRGFHDAGRDHCTGYPRRPRFLRRYHDFTQRPRRYQPRHSMLQLAPVSPIYPGVSTLGTPPAVFRCRGLLGDSGNAEPHSAQQKPHFSSKTACDVEVSLGTRIITQAPCRRSARSPRSEGETLVCLLSLLHGQRRRHLHVRD